MKTPWGRAQHIERLGDQGILSVSTAGHGGIFVPDALLPRIPEKQRAWAAHWSGSANWYEEDCCWAAVAVAFPELFPADHVSGAQRTLDGFRDRGIL